jgi:hypothetical protein
MSSWRPLYNRGVMLASCGAFGAADDPPSPQQRLGWLQNGRRRHHHQLGVEERAGQVCRSRSRRALLAQPREEKPLAFNFDLLSRGPRCSVLSLAGAVASASMQRTHSDCPGSSEM